MTGNASPSRTWRTFGYFQRLPAPTIRQRLFALVIGCILPIAGVAAFLIVSFYEHEQAQLTANATSRARAILSVLERDFAGTQAALQVLATSDRLVSGDLRGFYSRASAALPNMPADNIVVLDPSGQLLINTDFPFGDPLPKRNNPPLLKQILSTGKPAVSDLFYAKTLGYAIVAMGVPVRRNNEIVYSLNATIKPERIYQVLAEQKLPGGWRASITDSSGNVVARTHEMKEFLGKPVNPDLMQQLHTAEEGALKTRTLDGIPVITVYSRSRTTQWAVVLGMPLADLKTALRRTLAWLIVATLAALAAGFWWTAFIGRRIAESLSALTQPALALSSGLMPVIPRLFFKEANDMGHALLEAAMILQQAQYDAQHDSLTGLANRTMFNLVLGQQLQLCQRNKTRLAVLFIDLDGFKAVNDTHGHPAGDQLLRAMSVRIRETVRDSDIVARLGGDEFAIALLQSNLDNAQAFAGKLIDIISVPYQLADVVVTISASIGVAGNSLAADNVDTLLKHADAALYQAKALGKRRACVASA